MRRPILICVGFLLLAVLDLGIPLSVLANRAAILRDGTEVKLELTTRDPPTCFAAITACSSTESAISPTFRRPRRSGRAARPCGRNA